MADHERLVEEFIWVTGADLSLAIFFLESADWDLEVALSSFFESTDHDDQEQPSTVEYVSMASALNTAERSHAVNRMQTFKRTHVEQELSHEEGGSDRSGQQIQGPPEKKNADKRLDSLFKSAKEHGAEEKQEEEQRSIQANRGEFIGAGNSLEEIEDDSNVNATASQPHTGEQVYIMLKLWKAGFSVDNGPLRNYNDPENRKFLENVARGEVYQELVHEARGGEVNLDIEEFVNVKAFSGAGHMLGSPVANVIKSSESPACDSPPVVVVDEIRPTAIVVDEIKHTAIVVDETKPTAIVVDETKPTAIVVDETKPTAIVVDETKPTAIVVDEIKPTAIVVDEIKPTAIVVDQIKSTAIVVDEIKPTAIVVDETTSTAIVVDKIKPTAIVVDETKPTAIVVDETTPTAIVVDETTPTAIVVEETTPTSIVVDETTPTSIVVDETTPTAIVVDETTPTAIVVDETTPTAIVVDETTPTAIVLDETTPTAIVVDETTPTAIVVDETTPTAIVVDETTPAAIVVEETTPTAIVVDETTPTAIVVDETTPTAIVVDETKPVTNVQLRLAGGNSLVLRMNHVHTISDVRQRILATNPQYATSSFYLMTMFPHRELADETLTLEEAKLLNADIVQKMK